MLNKESGKVLAIIWDYDGTLVDTRQKNLNVTRKIIEKVSGTEWDNFFVLDTVENYHLAHIKTENWREFYKEHFGFDNNQIDATGSMWTAYQLDDQTPLPLIDGVEEALFSLQRYPQGIVSQNSKAIINQSLKDKNILTYFKNIIGYEEVELKKQKPNPEGLIMCIEKLTDLKPGIIIYIGDHETDVRCTANANNILNNKNIDINIVSIGAFYGFNVDTSDWSVLPDYKATKAEDIINIIGEVEKK